MVAARLDGRCGWKLKLETGVRNNSDASHDASHDATPLRSSPAHFIKRFSKPQTFQKALGWELRLETGVRSMLRRYSFEIESCIYCICCEGFSWKRIHQICMERRTSSSQDISEFLACFRKNVPNFSRKFEVSSMLLHWRRVLHKLWVRFPIKCQDATKVCAYVHMYICMYIYVSVRMYTHTYMHIHIYIYVCACTYVHRYICAYTYIYIYTCVHVFICSAPFQIHRARSNAVRLFCRHIPEEDRDCTTASVLASRSRTSPSTRPIASRPDFACTLGERLVMRPLFGSTLCCTHNCE